jgi:hypothetical protein
VAQKYHFFQKASARFDRRLVVEVLERQPDLVGTRGLEMARWRAFECGLLAIRQVGRIAQPYIACATQHALSLLLGPPHLIDGVVDDLDGMELVEGDGGTWQVLGGTLDEGRAHVDADLADRLGVTAMCGEVVGERGDGASLALGGEQHAGLVDIDNSVM